MHYMADAQQTVIVEKIGDVGFVAVAVLGMVALFGGVGVQRRPQQPVMGPVYDRCQQPAEEEDG